MKPKGKSKAKGASSEPTSDALKMRKQGSRVQKKVAKTANFLLKLKTTQKVLAAEAAVRKKKGKGAAVAACVIAKAQADAAGSALASLAEALGEALPLTGADGGAAGQQQRRGKEGGVLTASKKKKLVVDETRQMAAVLSHPAFKSDPFSALHEHLSRRIPHIAAQNANPHDSAATRTAASDDGDVNMTARPRQHRRQGGKKGKQRR